MQAKIILPPNTMPKTLIWEEKELYDPARFDVVATLWHDMDDATKAAMKRHSTSVELRFNEKELFPDKKMWGFPDTYVRIFRFSIAPRYNAGGKDFLKDEYPFMSVHNLFGSMGNNHIYLKTVEEGKEYAQKLYDIISAALVRK